MDTFGVIVAMLLLVFLFDGEPDVWDKLRGNIIGESCQKVEQPKREVNGFTLRRE